LRFWAINLFQCKPNSSTNDSFSFFADSDTFDLDEVPTYEPVARLFPRPGFHRPIVLVGPPGVGRNEIKRRIVSTDPDRFMLTVPRMKKTSFPL